MMEVTISKSNCMFIDESDWLHRLGQTYEDADIAMWRFVMTLAAGVDQFGKNDRNEIEKLYDLASQQVGLRKSTLKTYVSAAHSPKAPLTLEHGLTFQHARAVLGLDMGIADALLSQAKAGGWSPERLGSEAWAKKNGLPSPTSQRTLTGKQPPPPAPEVDDDPPFCDRTMYTDDGPVVEELWSDERIDAMVQQASFDATDSNGKMWQVVSANIAARLLRTMRDEYEIMLGRAR